MGLLAQSRKRGTGGALFNPLTASTVQPHPLNLNSAQDNEFAENKPLQRNTAGTYDLTISTTLSLLLPQLVTFLSPFEWKINYVIPPSKISAL